MFLLILVVVSLTIAWKYGDWRHWELYYSTSLYWIIGDITCSYLTYNMPLWSYHSAYLSHTFIDLLITKVSEMEQAVASVKNQSQQPGQAQQAQQPQQAQQMQQAQQQAQKAQQQVQQAQKANQQPQG